MRKIVFVLGLAAVMVAGCTRGNDVNGTVSANDADFAAFDRTMEEADSLYNNMDFRLAYDLYLQLLDSKGAKADDERMLNVLNSLCMASELSGHKAEQLQGMAGIIICPGFGQRGIEGKIIAAEYTRTHDIPTFGICLGMQMMVIEFARNVLGYADANSSEMDPATPHNVIDMMEEQKNITEKGGTMRLGAYECALREGSRAYEAYGQTTVMERHRHRYEFNNAYLTEYEAHGMQCVGVNPAAQLVEVVEIPNLRWYIGTQFHPEYSSTVLHPHPLFMSFIKACL